MDIVYFLKENSNGEELRYSLRSLKNFPHNRVWLYGGCPKWLNKSALTHIWVRQDKPDKWKNTAMLLEEVSKNDDITEDFVWFNDDFFVMKKIVELPYYRDRTLEDRINDFSTHLSSRYSMRLREADRALKNSGKPTNNFELHIPFIFNRAKLLEVIKRYPGVGAKRSLYGNTFVEESIPRQDVKIYTVNEKPTGEEDFISTSDRSFLLGEVGKYLKNKFRSRSIFELTS